MMSPAALEARLKAVLLNGATGRRLFRLRQQHPELAFELDQIALALKDGSDEIVRWCCEAQHDDAA